MSLKNPMQYFSFAFLLCLVTGAFAQGVFEGSGESFDNCVGDGCGFVPQESPAENVTVENNIADSTTLAADTVATDSTDEEFYDDDEQPRFINESSEEYRARKEGFTKGVLFGVKAGAGTSILLGQKNDGWNLGFDGSAGITAKLPLNRFFSVATELNFTYRLYSYEAPTADYGKIEADISEMLFEIPIMGEYFFDEDGFYLGFGINIGLRMQGESDVKQIVSKDGSFDSDKRSNTIPTAGVECGGLIALGYEFSKQFTIDIRGVQNFTNMLDLDLMAESVLMSSKLYGLHVSINFAYFI